MNMSQQICGLLQTMQLAREASRIDNDEVQIAADDAGGAAAAEKVGAVLKDDQRISLHIIARVR